MNKENLTIQRLEDCIHAVYTFSNGITSKFFVDGVSGTLPLLEFSEETQKFHRIKKKSKDENWVVCVDSDDEFTRDIEIYLDAKERDEAFAQELNRFLRFSPCLDTKLFIEDPKLLEILEKHGKHIELTDSNSIRIF